MDKAVFLDNDGSITLVPRYYQTDGYTIPLWISWLGGGSMQWDIRPAVSHDFECKFHQRIVVNLTIEELKGLKLLRLHNISEKDGKIESFYPIWVCEDIPVKYLTFEKAAFNEVNARFKRMMAATELIKPWRVRLMRFAVNFNPGWLMSGKKSFDISKIYKLRTCI